MSHDEVFEAFDIYIKCRKSPIFGGESCDMWTPALVLPAERKSTDAIGRHYSIDASANIWKWRSRTDQLSLDASVARDRIYADWLLTDCNYSVADCWTHCVKVRWCHRSRCWGQLAKFTVNLIWNHRTLKSPLTLPITIGNDRRATTIENLEKQ